MTITLDAAQGLLDRACAHAAVIGVPMDIAVVHAGGHLLAFARMDGAIPGSIDIALAKAKTSILFNGPSENLWEFCKPGRPAPRRRPDPLRRRRGDPRRRRNLIGAVGVCGGLPIQDGEVARAATGKDA
jgi:uncharacterized protein GlcG (DUF336 family)